MQKAFVTKNISLKGADSEAKRAEILEYFLKTYELYEKLFELLASDDVFYKRPEALRHPIIFYFGHTAAFYINKLVLAKKLQRINPSFESMFAIGVDEMSWDDLREDRYKWPSVDEVRSYRESVKEAIIGLIKSEPLSLPIKWDDTFWTILMCCEHDRIHLETSSVLIRQLDIGDVRAHELFVSCKAADSAPANELLDVDGGKVTLGKTDEDDFYGWDNEYGKFECEIKDFKASKYLVSNGEFMEFVRDGGYQKPHYWDEEGQKWLEFKKPMHPVFWVAKEGKYLYRTLAEEVEMPLNFPVDVNYLEAKAFCNWLGAKTGKNIDLPSEAEWHRLSEYASVDENTPANINLEYYASACPVNGFAHGKFCDVIGNVWQWTKTPIYPFDGFRTHPLYDDFSTPTFDDRHNIIKGGSFISTGNELLPCSRYAFRRHFFQHAGFRYVVSPNGLNEQMNVYETDKSVSEYLEFHYGDEYFGVPNFPSKIARIALSMSAGTGQKRALEVGCSVGRCSFELSRVFESVTGIDFSARFIKNAVQMQKEGVVRYKIATEGESYEQKEVTADELDIDESARASVEFWQGDACNLKPHFTGYDLVVAANLIDRLYDPAKFLKDIKERINKGGVLLLASPYSWSEDFTTKDKWLGNGGRSSLDEITKLLSPEFEPMMEPLDVEFVIRESERKYQHTVSQVSVWKKKK